MALVGGGLLAASLVAGALQYGHQPAARRSAGGSRTEGCPRTAGLVSPARPEAPAAVAALGERLFDDRQLSADGTVSCATCHQRARAFTDGRPRAVGIGGRIGWRNTPQIFNLADGPLFLWDGRAPTLEDAVRGALTHPAAMGMTDDR